MFSSANELAAKLRAAHYIIDPITLEVVNVVGPQGSSSGELISPNTLMRERLADNVATAGQEELNGLAFNQNLVVTVPGNTRFYIVVQKPSSERTAAMPSTRGIAVTSAGFSGVRCT